MESTEKTAGYIVKLNEQEALKKSAEALKEVLEILNNEAGNQKYLKSIVNFYD